MESSLSEREGSEESSPPSNSIPSAPPPNVTAPLLLPEPIAFTLSQEFQDLTSSSQPPGPTASSQPPGPTASSQPPGPTASSQPPGPTASSQPPGPTASSQPPGPTASSQPPGPTASSQPPGPTASSQPPGPTASSQPPGPTASSQHPGLTASSQPPGPTASSQPPGPTASSQPPGPTASSEPPGPTASSQPPGPTFSSQPPGPTASSEPPGPTASSQPPGPTASSQPPGPTASSQPPGPTASSQPPGPTASSQPPGPTASSQPPVPTASSQPPGPTASSQPPGPTASSQPPVPTASSQPPGPTASSQPPGPTASSQPPVPTASSQPPGPTASPPPLDHTALPQPSEPTPSSLPLTQTPSRLEPTQPTICVLHRCNETYSGKLKTISQESLQKIEKCAEARRQQAKGAFADVLSNLPRKFEEKHGYHPSCYRRFTAMPSQLLNIPASSFRRDPGVSYTEVPQRDPVEKPKTLRSSGASVSTQKGKPILEPVCIFCKKAKIKVGYKRQKLVKCSTDTFERTIREECVLLNDFNIIRSVGTTDFVAAEVNYHMICRARFSKSASVRVEKNPKEQTDATIWVKQRQAHKEAFTALCEYIEDYILKKHEITNLSDLYETYLDFLSAANYEKGREEFLMHHFESKIMNKFGQHLRQDKLGKDKIIYKAGVNITEAMKVRYALGKDKDKPEEIVKKAGHILRKIILKMEGKTFHSVLSVEQMLNNTNDIPDLLRTFLIALYKGPVFRGSKSEFTKRMTSIGSDLVFTVSHGNYVPAKHLALGLGFKTITGKKEVVQILNKLGHSINYWMAEEMETQMADEIALNNSFVPSDFTRDPELSTFVAFDNYDENVETLSGKGSLHETVGICVQRVQSTPQAVPSTFSECHSQKRSRKRKYENADKLLQPYAKKLKLVNCILTDTVLEKNEKIEDAERRDLFWVLSHYCHKTDIPMWIGYNSKTVTDNSHIQKVSYLQNYNEHSTDPPMIVETLKITRNIAEECGQKYGLVTYDLAIAKPAMQIQSMESPEYDNVFIHFGSFHIFLAFFSALGKVVSESGLSQILIQSDVIADNSLKGVLLGRHYNRCKRLHPMFALALRLSHLQSFVEQSDVDIPHELSIYLLNVYHDRDYYNQNFPDDVKAFIKEYERYSQATRNGEHGATAKFWFSYIEYINLYLKMSRAIRMNDIDLFTYCLTEVINLFFMTNHQNYARWMVKYQQNLKDIDDKYPNLREQLEKGGLSVKRSRIPFSATPIDQTLECTVNRDAASRLSGIVAMTNKESAHSRWTVTRTMRSQVVTGLKEIAGIDKKEDVSKELRKSRIARDNIDLQAMRQVIEDSANPFADELKNDTLYNIGTGKAASEQTKSFLLSISANGDRLRKKFIEECLNDKERFNLPIKRQTIHNFEKEGIKIKTNRKDTKVKELELNSGLFGRICAIAVDKKIDLDKLLTYSLTPLPLSLAHIDGTMAKTDKSALLRHLEKISPTPAGDCPTKVMCLLIDGMYFLHNLPKKLPQTFGELSSYILRQICSNRAVRIDFVFDQYKSPSIKDSEKLIRGNEMPSGRDFIIQGRQQRIPPDFLTALRNEDFKRAFTVFLGRDWQRDDIHQSTIGQKKFYFTCENACFVSQGNRVQEVQELFCCQQEADTRLLFNCNHAIQTRITNREQENTKYEIVVRTGDTDVLVVFLSNINRLKVPESIKIWLDFGSGRNRRLINITTMIQKLGNGICSALPGIHAFTGCDFISAFVNKGKIRPFNILSKNKKFQEAFSSLGESSIIPENVANTIEEFTCELYNQKTSRGVNQARSRLFNKTTRPKNDAKIFDAIKKIDPATFPPCHSVLTLKIERTNYVCSMWTLAEKSDPIGTHNPIDSGWRIDEGHYAIQWDSKPYLPENLNDILEFSEEESDPESYSHSSEDSDDSDDFEE